MRIYEKGADMMSRVCVYINSNDISRDFFSVGSKRKLGFRSKLNGNEKLTELSPWWCRWACWGTSVGSLKKK